MSATALTAVQARISVELGRERAEGWPLKAAYDRVARRLGLSARRVRAFHHHEVRAEAVTADDLLCIDPAFRRAIAEVVQRIEALKEIVGAVESGDPLRGLALSAMAGGGQAPLARGGADDPAVGALGRAEGVLAPAAGRPGPA